MGLLGRKWKLLLKRDQDVRRRISLQLRGYEVLTGSDKNRLLPGCTEQDSSSPLISGLATPSLQSQLALYVAASLCLFVLRRQMVRIRDECTHISKPGTVELSSGMSKV
ncbi:hypothetical protein An15g05210 [Aspergillus niger]|uniref:Uncharacterized protein n=2 Tax=Aspergillus niger TaxID=5061 RepID=A2R5Q8_ASPNC|nr:hypothetical protein An15g05210 [Aspergillus niger]CAK42494.1 hypothetical protein An15g05210 [Aspergillus niger]